MYMTWVVLVDLLIMPNETLKEVSVKIRDKGLVNF